MKRVCFSFRHFRPVVTAVICTFVAGCATSTAPSAPPVSPDDPTSVEKAAFDLASDFYCNRKRWPLVWSELVEFQRQRGGDTSWVEQVKDPKVSSPRAIFLTFEYMASDQAPRRATYIAPPRCGQESAKGVVAIAADGVVFRLPDGFELMPVKDVQQRWKAPPYPDAAWSATDGRVLAIRFGDLDMKAEELSQYAEDMAEAYESSIPSLVWTFKDSKVIGGKPVLYHEFQSTASTGPILNVVFSGSFDSRLFAITITGPTEHSDAVVQAARQIEQTLQIR
jgi:hypothetical protein